MESEPVKLQAGHHLESDSSVPPQAGQEIMPDGECVETLRCLKVEELFISQGGWPWICREHRDPRFGRIPVRRTMIF